MRLITSCADNDLISTSFQVETKCGSAPALGSYLCQGPQHEAEGENWEEGIGSYLVSVSKHI